jgi:hypothetical protein
MMLDFSAASESLAAQHVSKQQSELHDISSFFSSPEPASPFASVGSPMVSPHKPSPLDTTSSVRDDTSVTPPLLNVVAALLHGIQLEAPDLVSVCLESLVKIALWCPIHGSPLRELIREEIYEINASSFGLTHPLMGSLNSRQCNEESPFDIFNSAHTVDPRSTLSTIDRLGLSHVLDLPRGGGVVSGSEHVTAFDSNMCHYQAHKIGNEWQSSSVCRMSALYSLALESLDVSKKPPRLASRDNLSSLSASNMDSIADSDDLGGGGQSSGKGLFGGGEDLMMRQPSFDLIGDLISPVEDSPLPGGGGDGLATTGSSFVVDDAELNRLLFQLHRRATK